MSLCLLLTAIVLMSESAVGEPIESDISGGRGSYNGTLRVFVSEIVSRWSYDYDDSPLRNAVLSFAIDEEFQLTDGDTLSWDTTWNGNDYHDIEGVPFGDVTEDNIKVFAAVFNSFGYTMYSDPPWGAPFTAYDVDACAAATCGSIGYNVFNEDFTHSVFIEDAATEW
jgi:hypothetical protein